MLDHDSGRPHPSLVDLAAHRAARPTIDPIQLHCRRPVWQPVTVSDPEAALRSTIAQATRQPVKPTARTADMSLGIDQALEDADQQGYVRGHADGLEAAVLCERIDWYAMGAISGVIGVWVVRSVLPVVIQGLDQLLGWLL